MRFGRLSLCSALVYTCVITGPQVILAQDETPKPGLIVFSQNICPYENVRQLRQIFDSLFAPVLDELVANEQLIGWALLSQWWGDEWNWNLYYTAENYQAFLDFWNAYVRRLNASRPGWNTDVTSLCTEHRDTFYTVVRSGGMLLDLSSLTLPAGEPTRKP